MSDPSRIAWYSWSSICGGWAGASSGSRRSAASSTSTSVYHVYATYGRGTDVFNTFYQLLDRAPKGRDEEALLRGEGEWWWRRHDEYENG
jgi:predicted dithiol-disulfide oxidoreductase (DUF899 family)